MVLVTTSFLKLAIWSLRRTFGVWRKRQPHTLFVVRLLHATGWDCGERNNHTRSPLFDCYMPVFGSEWTVQKQTASFLPFTLCCREFMSLSKKCKRENR
ncbi:hypothetical protein RRG08_032721 [Elysia crispata]|uniref:Uncharacterized protein n=1 Tax=Elysia crispata TaxID=231223 RepID=A0AAE0YW11_9GAST|nr:hypothetical protein RRG08_032721 [Elysia crispata]